MEEARSVEALESPWFCYTHSYVPHLPYEIDTLDAFIDETSGNSERIRELYEKSIESTVEQFRERYQAVEERGELDDTLFVFTSDHGEFLGESGLVGHSSPIAPGGIQVPTVFIHPDLPDADPGGIARSIDLYPTALNAVGADIPEWVDGVSLLDEAPTYGHAYSVAKINNATAIWEASSVWDADGGYVQVHSNPLNRGATALAKVLYPSKYQSHYIRRNLGQLGSFAKYYLQQWQRHESPAMSEDRARELISEYREQEPIQREEGGITSEQREHLQDLGYL
jgi:arylsulfatase A-like enzyme